MAQEIMMIEMVVDTALFEQRTEAVKTETRGVDGELMDRIKGHRYFQLLILWQLLMCISL